MNILLKPAIIRTFEMVWEIGLSSGLLSVAGLLYAVCHSDTDAFCSKVSFQCFRRKHRDGLMLQLEICIFLLKMAFSLW
jgi:hypothetical protein